VILNKPGKLTDEEFEIMKTHTTAGGNIITSLIDKVPDSDYLYEAKNLAMYHHEKWNGKGYPSGLAGEDIPLSARVMAVADVFDALISNRCYKKGFPYDKALGIIREERGRQFDPKIVDAFFAAEDQILEVADKFSEKEKQNATL
jgi:HD-GYP domain-containing protein (c-di-GMP phosphodiesterase class II)